VVGWHNSAFGQLIEANVPDTKMWYGDAPPSIHMQATVLHGYTSRFRRRQHMFMVLSAWVAGAAAAGDSVFLIRLRAGPLPRAASLYDWRKRA